MKSIWIIIAGALLVFGIIYYMNKVAPEPMPGLTAGGETVDVVPQRNVVPSEKTFEPLDLSLNKKNIFIKSANADVIVPDERLAVRTLGDENAAVKMYVVSSLTCAHCADFHVKALKEIEKKYVETGKVFFTYVDFPVDRRALAGAMLARCVPTKNYFSFLNVLFENQNKWAFKSAAQDIISEYASLQGLSKADVKVCLADKALQQSIINNRDAFAKKYNITATPTTIIVKGDKEEVLVGADKQRVELALEKMLK